MTDITRQSIEKILANYQDPYLQQNLLTAKVIKDIQIDSRSIKVNLEFGYPLAGIKQELTDKLTQLLKPVAGDREVSLAITSRIESHVGQKGVKGLPQVKNIIAVASGKGGVGKSTVSVNLALALVAEGARVGILDADIYGPSQPKMLGIETPPPPKDPKKLLPIIRHGLQSMSIGYLIDASTPMIWRGPMVSMALQQLLNDTHWEELDYLVIDLPPGTGDIQLTLAQKIPVSGAVIVTTPQDLALLDARRATEMFQKVHVPVLGVIENMSTYVCTQCGHEEHIFGQGGGERLAKEYAAECIGSLPLNAKIREQTDSGLPPVIADPNGPHAQTYRDIARRVSAKIALQGKDYSSKFPNIVVKSD